MASGRKPHIRGHPEDKMVERSVRLDDIHKALREGSLDSARFENGTWRYNIKLDRPNLSEEHFVVVIICSEESIAVVTTMKRFYKK